MDTTNNAAVSNRARMEAEAEQEAAAEQRLERLVAEENRAVIALYLPLNLCLLYLTDGHLSTRQTLHILLTIL